MHLSVQLEETPLGSLARKVSEVPKGAAGAQAQDQDPAHTKAAAVAASAAAEVCGAVGCCPKWSTY